MQEHVQSAPDRSGWLTFAVTLFIMLGLIDIIYGIAMIANSDYVVFTPEGAWLFDITVWGWITLAIGVLQVLVGWGITTGSGLARVLGLTLAVLAAVNAIFVMPIYAVWGILSFVVALMIVLALSRADQRT